MYVYMCVLGMLAISSGMKEVFDVDSSGSVGAHRPPISEYRC